MDLDCPVMLCDAQAADMPIVYCNEAFEKLTGDTRVEVLGRKGRLLHSPPPHIKTEMSIS